ncbi:MAG: hypothetical protein EP297_13455 [Gammaproteobacteria bacterium]|nr:MAG: hypothetical protein EP297_13455 [Gammaproteobacteria bacterium]
MKRKGKPLFRIAAIIVSVGMISQAWSSDDYDRARTLMERGDILPLEQILQRMPDTNARILEVELEHEHGRMVYEVEVLNPNGYVREYLFDAQTGKLLSVEEED